MGSSGNLVRDFEAEERPGVGMVERCQISFIAITVFSSVYKPLESCRHKSRTRAVTSGHSGRKQELTSLLPGVW